MNPTPKTYIPSAEVQEKRTRDYKYLREMIDLKNKAMPHFTGPDTGMRSFNDNIDQSEKVLNGYTLTRADQGKEEWQSNLLDNVSRAKLRGIAAGVGLKVPEMKWRATNKNGLRSVYRAQIFKNITKHTFNTGNPIKENFEEVWQRVGHGVTFSYEGYQTGGAKRKTIESFDSVEGKIKFKEEYVKFDGKPVSILLNPQEFYWWTFYAKEVNDQPRLAWLQKYSPFEVESEFSKLPNYQYVKDAAKVRESGTQDTTYYKAWSERVSKKDEYEVFRYYSIEEDVYRVYVNGVLLIDAPMIWGGDEKYYPFAKTILEPYANTNFFVGMPFGQMIEAYQDGKNTVLNTIIDKLYRSVKPRTLVGLQNKDLFDVQNDITEEDNFIYVPDVNAVKPEPINSVNAGDLNILNMLDQGLESVSISSASQGIPQKNVTATADQLAAARAAEIKSNLFIYSEDLWLQKTRLRVQTILTHFMKDTAVREYMRDRIIHVYDYSFGDGSRGTLGIHIAKNKNDLMSLQEIEARELAAQQQGENYKIISIPSTYLDEWECDFEVIPESLAQEDAKSDEESLDGLIQWLGLVHPEFLAANKDKFLEEKLSLHGRNIEEYAPPAPMPTPEEALAAQAQQGGGQAPAPEPSVLGLQ